MQIEDYFPQGIATGEAFLGRSKDMGILRQNIEAGHHTLLLAPRRYGKTSLIVNTLAKIKIPYMSLDLHLAISSQAVEKKMLKCLQELMGLVISKPEQLVKIAQSFFNKSKKKWTLGIKGLAGVELQPDTINDVPDNILTALSLTEEILKKKKQRAVIFIDEVQEIESLQEGKQIAGAIRHFAQQPKRHLTFIFSGSNRRMLLQMFADSTAPLFELCERLTIERLEPNVYKKYLNKITQKIWREKLNNDTFERIITITECHPKRIYNLCYQLWYDCLKQKTILSKINVDKAWMAFIKKQIRDVRFNLSQLSAGKIKILTLIAVGNNHHLTGQKTIKNLAMSGAAIVKIIQLLEENDYIEKLEGDRYRITDPLIRDVLAFYENENIV